jgi:tetratricopeptide (TPR) repeat protein
MQLTKTNSEIKDVFYGLGMYDYWRSALTKVLWWMPGIENKCSQGIKELIQAKDLGTYTTIAASANLVLIYNNEKRYEESLELADQMLGRFPESLAFLMGKGAALSGLSRFDDAEKIYRGILSKVEAESFDNHYNAVLCHFFIGKIYFKQRRAPQCIAECEKMESYNLEGNIKTRLNKYFSEASQIKEQARAFGKAHGH